MSIPNKVLLHSENQILDSKKILQVNHLFKKFSEKENAGGLKDVSFTVPEGKVVAIIGESGSGKTTLLKTVYGLLKVDSGEVFFQGERVKGPDEQLIPGHPRMRMVSQHFDDLNLHANVWDNVASQLSNTDLEKKTHQTQLILERLKIVKLKSQRIVDLSGGEKQRVAIARALVTGPTILLMDEPFNQIDSSFRDTLQLNIRQIVEETGLTVLLVSHDPTEVMGLADHLIILQNGVISAKGESLFLYQNPPNAYVAKMLSKSNILTSEEAEFLGLNGQPTAIHPEWITLLDNKEGEFIIKRIIHRGFYEEAIVFNGALKLRVYLFLSNQWSVGDSLSVHINKSISF